MNWEAISAIGEILAATGMIGSLLFVGVQIRYDRKATEFEAIVRRQVGAREAFSSVATSDHLAPIYAKITKDNLPPAPQLLVDVYGLDPEEAIRLDAMYTVFARQGTSTLQMPMSDKERANVEAALVAGMGNNSPFGVWWEAGKQILPTDIVAHVDHLRQEAEA